MTTSKQPDHFYGSEASYYEHKRHSQPVWQEEEAVAEEFIQSLCPGSTCLDVPVGTGRFFKLYDRHEIATTGVDLSLDMLALAERRASRLSRPVRLLRGSIFALPFGSDSFDAAVCFRLLTWLDRTHAENALCELARVSRRSVLLTVNVGFPFVEAVGSGQLGSFLRVGIKKRRAIISVLRRRLRREASLHIHSRDTLLETVDKVGLSLSREWVLREDPGVRRYVAWLLTRGPEE